MATLTVCIGNSDDKLPQATWSQFWAEVSESVHDHAGHLHGEFLTAPNAPWQSAAWVLECDSTDALCTRLSVLATAYGQDSIAVSVGETTLVRPVEWKGQA